MENIVDFRVSYNYTQRDLPPPPPPPPRFSRSFSFLMAICSFISPFVLCFPSFFHVTIPPISSLSPSSSNNTIFLSDTQQQEQQQPYTLEHQHQQQPYIPEQQQQQQPLLKFHPKHVTNKNKTKYIMKIPHINIIYDKTTSSQQIVIKMLNKHEN